MSELVQLTDAQRALAEVESVEDAKVLYDKLEALSQYARRYRVDHDKQNEIAEAKLRTARKGGALIPEQFPHGGDARFRNGTLVDAGLTKQQSHRWRTLASVADADFEEHLAAVKASDEELTLAGALRFQRLGVHFSSDTGEWETPQDLFDELDAEFSFTLDVCATAKNAKCARYFTHEDDGLAQDWRDNACWMNPPYGSKIGLWVEKAAMEASRLTNRPGSGVVCLVPARTDTAWWWDYCLRGEIRFLRGRLRFGDGNTGAPFPSAIVVFPGPRRVVWWERAA